MKRKKKTRSLATCSGSGSILGSKKGTRGVRKAAGRKLGGKSCKRRKK